MLFLYPVVPGSSVVERLTVNQFVVGSNPTPGALDINMFQSKKDLNYVGLFYIENDYLNREAKERVGDSWIVLQGVRKNG